MTNQVLCLTGMVRFKRQKKNYMYQSDEIKLCVRVGLLGYDFSIIITEIMSDIKPI